MNGVERIGELLAELRRLDLGHAEDTPSATQTGVVVDGVLAFDNGHGWSRWCGRMVMTTAPRCGATAVRRTERP